MQDWDEMVSPGDILLMLIRKYCPLNLQISQNEKSEHFIFFYNQNVYDPPVTTD